MKASTVRGLLVGALAVATAAVLTSVRSRAPGPAAQSRLPPARQAVARAALSQLGNGDPKRYWYDVLPGVSVGNADWCGAGALWCLHQAGLALDRHWVIESGFLLTPPALPTTKQPEVGDIAYFEHNQHHAVVVGVASGFVSLVSINGVSGLVSASNVAADEVTAFFSISPLISSARV